MGSPNDNLTIKDGGDNEIKTRAMDVSASSNGSLLFMRHLATSYPVDYGVGGCYQSVARGGSMGAGLASNSPILALRNSLSTSNIVLRRIQLRAWTLGTGFAAGIANFELYASRNFTVMDTGGLSLSLTGNLGKLRTSMATAAALIQYSSTGALTPGTRTLDTNPVETKNVGAPTTTYTPLFGSDTSDKLYEKLGSDHPLVLTQNEGLVLQATVPATGIWSWSAKIEWDEIPLVNY